MKDLLQFLTTTVHDVLSLIVTLVFLAGVFLYAIARLPADNPLRRLLGALTLRVGATIGAGIVAIPIEPIPVIDIAYDIAVPLALVYFWATLFREIAAIFRDARRPEAAPARIAYRQRTPPNAPPVIEGELLPDGEDTRSPPRLPR